MPTYGENLVAALLSKLPKKEYYWFAEPHIPAEHSAYHDPDFVIVSAHLGVIVLEVKDWVEIIRIDQKKAEIKRRDGEIMLQDNPVQIARKYALNLSDRFQEFDELLHTYQGKERLSFPWMYAVALTNMSDSFIRECEKRGIWDKGQVLGQRELTPQCFEQALRDLPSPWQLKQPLNTQTLNTIRGVLNPEYVVADKGGKPVGVTTLGQQHLIEEPLKVKMGSMPLPLPTTDSLTKEAEGIVENTSVRLVRGVAGSGKSLVLARRGQFLAEKYPDHDILILAFNKHLIADLEARITGAANLEITNFHQMCVRIMGEKWQSPQQIQKWLKKEAAKILEQNDLDMDFVAEEIEWRKELDIDDNQHYLGMLREGRGSTLSQSKREIINAVFDQYNHDHYAQGFVDWSDIPFLTLVELKPGHPLHNHYDVILIDEAQDFAPSWIRIIKKLLKPDGHLFMCDDPTQSLFRSFSWKQKGIDVIGRTRILRVPFRNTFEITQAAHALIGEQRSDDILEPNLTTYELPSGNMPTFFNCRDLEQEVELITEDIHKLIQSGVAGDEIAILCHNKRLIKHWASLRDEGCYVSSFNQMKGLEFKVVFLPYLQTVFTQAGSTPDETFINQKRRHIFTAMTRAREKLIMSYHGKCPSELAPLEPYVQNWNRASYYH